MKLIDEIVTGWPLTLKKLSAQLEAVQLVAVVPVLFAMQDQLGPNTILLIIALLSGAKLVASNWSQSNIGTYDKSKFTLTPIDPHGDVNE